MSQININPFSTRKIEKLDFWDANNSSNIKTSIYREPQVQSLSNCKPLESLLNIL